MGPTRFPYGEALGFVNNFNYRSTTANLLTEGDATPNVTTGSLFYSNNTSNTTITHFDLDDYANRAANYEGKIITVLFLDNSTRLANAVNVYLAGTNNLVNRDATSIHGITLMHSRSGWYELQRHMTNRNEVLQYSISGTSSLNVDDVKVGLILNTGGVTTAISALSGGQIGQSIILANAGSNAVRVETGGNIIIVGTNAYVLNASGAYQFIRASGTLWRMVTIGTLGNA